jgi:thioredoxin-like negative regulator of GroEL
MFAVLMASALMAFAVIDGVVIPQEDYATAYNNAQNGGRPLMVVISSEACPGCVNLKNTTLKEMQLGGQLEGVSLVVIDRDQDPTLASKLMRGTRIPQIIMFSKASTGRWQRSQLTGFQSSGPIRDLIRGALSAFHRS